MSALATLLALAPLASASPYAPAQSGDLVELLISEGDPVPGLTPASPILALFRPIAGRGGGWVAPIVADPGSTSQEPYMFIGESPSGLSILRQSQVIQGVTQGRLFGPSMANGELAYIDAGLGSTFIRKVWVEDELIAQKNLPVPGSNGWTWDILKQVELTTSGEAFVVAQVTDNMGRDRDVIWKWPSEQVLFASLRQIDGFDRRIERFDSDLDVSPDGSHWSILAREVMTGRRGVVIDGDMVDLGGGQLAVANHDVPDSLSGSFGPSTWVQWQRAAVLNNAGDYAFEGTIRVANSGLEQLYVRSGRPFLDEVPQLDIVGIDARGALLATGPNNNGASVILEEYPVLGSTLQVDDDGDGQSDPGYEVLRPPADDVIAPTDQNRTIFRSSMSFQGGALRNALFRGRDFRTDQPGCEGVENSTGSPAQLVAIGSRFVSDNEVSLRLFGLPTGSTGYVLVSTTAGFTAGAGGSQGNLCLSGSIGRMLQQVFVAEAEGRAAVAFDVTAIPQPVGSAVATAGETWFAQAWYRDSLQGAAVSNFSSSSAIAFD